MAGMDPMEFLEERDPFRRRVMGEISIAFKDEQDRLDQNRANQISNAVWGAVKSK